jgi:hypothetical protein
MIGKTLKELPTLYIQYLTQLFNAILLRGYFPTHWKVAQIIRSPGNPLTNYPLTGPLASYPLPL